MWSNFNGSAPSMIDHLQNYYGIAIRSNIGSLENNKKAIYAAVFHVASSETNNWHQHFPNGSDSRCSFTADIASGTKIHKAGKGLRLCFATHQARV